MATDVLSEGNKSRERERERQTDRERERERGNCRQHLAGRRPAARRPGSTRWLLNAPKFAGVTNTD